MIDGIVIEVTFFVRDKLLNVYAADAMTGVTDAPHNSANSRCSPHTSVIDSMENSGHMSTFTSSVPHNSYGHTTENQGKKHNYYPALTFVIHVN